MKIKTETPDFNKMSYSEILSYIDEQARLRLKEG
jgi:hypothetical protein